MENNINHIVFSWNCLRRLNSLDCVFFIPPIPTHCLEDVYGFFFIFSVDNNHDLLMVLYKVSLDMDSMRQETWSKPCYIMIILASRHESRKPINLSNLGEKWRPYLIFFLLPMMCIWSMRAEHAFIMWVVILSTCKKRKSHENLLGKCFNVFANIDNLSNVLGKLGLMQKRNIKIDIM